MISTATPIEFSRRLSSGKTRPAILVCDRGDEEVEVVAKLAAGCERRETALAIEIVSGLLAGDLGIPIPEPLLVTLDPDWVDAIPDMEWAGMARSGPPMAFGSKLLPSAFSAWVEGIVPVGSMTVTAANILLFDAAIENPDRRLENPNCLVRGEDIRIFDHELAFPPMLIGAQKPWVVGALQFMATPGTHIFRDALYQRQIDWAPITQRWKSLSNDRLDEYEAALPGEWNHARAHFLDAIEKIKDARDNIDGCLAEVQRLLA